MYYFISFVKNKLNVNKGKGNERILELDKNFFMSLTTDLHPFEWLRLEENKDKKSSDNSNEKYSYRTQIIFYKEISKAEFENYRKLDSYFFEQSE